MAAFPRCFPLTWPLAGRGEGRVASTGQPGQHAGPPVGQAAPKAQEAALPSPLEAKGVALVGGGAKHHVPLPHVQRTPVLQDRNDCISPLKPLDLAPLRLRKIQGMRSR